MKIVKLNFLGKEYDIRCKEDEVTKIKNLESRLNNRVRQFSKKNQNFTDTHKLLIATLSLEDKVDDLLLNKKILENNLDDSNGNLNDAHGDEHTEKLFDQDSNEEEDFEIPAFLRKQKF